MADKNICNVELLNSMSENTNVIIDENGVLKKLNLYKEISAISSTPSTGGDTLPVESQFYWDKDEEIPDGYVEAIPPFSNLNLLINGDFRNPVNQRGAISYNAQSASHYTLDRWKVSAKIKVIVNNGSVTFENTDTTNYMYISQPFEKTLPSDKYTFSCNVKNVNGVAWLYDYDTFKLSKGINYKTIEDEIGSFTFGLEPGSSIELEWCKLEQGSIATPFVPKSYGEEYAICQRYYQSYSNPWARRISNNFAKFYFKSEMRVAPTLIGTFRYYSLAGTDWGEITSDNIYTYTDRIDMWASGSSDWYVAAQDVSFDAEIY